MSLHSAGSDSTANGDSDSSSSSANSTSTYRYSHEAYETFQEKVSTLARGLGDVETVSLQRQRGGSYNRVVIVRLKMRAGETVHGIFRIPRSSGAAALPEDGESDEIKNSSQIDTNILDQAAVLQFLQSTDIAAPGLLGFDASGVNAIRSPYILQECSTGTPLLDVYGSMSKREKLYIANDLVAVLLSAEKIKFARSGSIGRNSDSPTDVKRTFLLGSVEPTLEVEVRDTEIANEEVPLKSLADLLTRKLQYWYQKEPTFGKPNPVTAMWQRLTQLVVEMQANGVFELDNASSAETKRSILYHWDLEPRNMLVKRDNTGKKWEIDMVIDWDEVLAVPAVLARKPPIWLWDFSDDFEHSSMRSDYDGDVDLLEPSRYNATGGKLSADDQYIRQHFEDTLVRGLAEIYDGYSKDIYLEETYGKGRWIRRIARFAFHGAGNSQDLDRYKHLDKDWRAYLETLDANSEDPEPQIRHGRQHSACRFLQKFFGHSKSAR